MLLEPARFSRMAATRGPVPSFRPSWDFRTKLPYREALATWLSLIKMTGGETSPTYTMIASVFLSIWDPPI